jgi:long-chain acyl-CoA synthetase
VDPSAPQALLHDMGERCGNWSILDPAVLNGWPAGDSVDNRTNGLPALVLFTSGTSGIPKGVPVSMRNLSHSASTVAGYLNYAGNPSAAVVLPLHYSYALLSQVLCMMCVGGYSRIFGSFRNPLKFAQSVEAEELRTFCGVPTTYQALLTLRKLAPVTLPQVRVICSAGAAFDRSWLPAVKEVFPNATFFDNYGMTEATPRVSYIREDDARFTESTCGKAIDGLEIGIFDEATQRPLPDGEIGVIGVRGPNVFDGYLNDPEASQAAFTRDGFLLSGDLGYLDAGYLFVRGRRDEVFNVGGEKVSPAEIERVLAGFGGVEQCAVSSVEDPRRGTVPVAYLVLSTKVSKGELNTYLRARLPANKVPWHYYETRQLPMTSNGKLQRRRLVVDHSEYVIKEVL